MSFAVPLLRSRRLFAPRAPRSMLARMFDHTLIGHRFEPFTVEVEKGPMRLFAKAIGETDPIYTDEAAAVAAGYRGMRVPLTYLFCLETLSGWDDQLNLLLGTQDVASLHGEQRFEYFAPACSGDRLTFSRRVSDIYEKAGGRLDFLVTETEVVNQDDTLIARMISTGMVDRGTP